MTAQNETRINEWYVPKFGPTRFRVFVGLLFLPYTGMCISFTIIGSLLTAEIVWERVAAIALIYALALGVSAHAADTLGSKKLKPWGTYFSRNQLLALMVGTLAAAYVIGAYYIIWFVPLLAVIAVLEGFFLAAYNFEILGGRFHNDFWFAFSWGVLPTLAGQIMQTNAVSLLAMAVALAAGFVSYLEIRMSRPYKALKREAKNDGAARKLERGLKALSVGTIAFCTIFLIIRAMFS